MKIYSRFISFLCIALLVMNVPSYGQSNNVYDSYKKKLTDFKDCVFGTKVCSPREKAIKYTAVTIAALVLLSSLIYAGERLPFIMREGSIVATLQEKLNNIEKTYYEILPSVREYQKSLPELYLDDPIAKFMSTDEKLKDIKKDLEHIQNKMNYVNLKERKKALKRVTFEINELARNIKIVQEIIKVKK